MYKPSWKQYHLHHHHHYYYPIHCTEQEDVVENKTPLLQPSCRRECPNNNQYPNIILLTHLGRAGWSDRVYMFLSILQLAGYLCAQLYVPRPNRVLSPKHNHNVELSLNVSWMNDLANFQFVESNYTISSPLVEWENPNDINKFTESE